MNDTPPKTAEQPAFIAHQYAFAAHIRDPQHKPCPADVEERRMNIYRELFFNNVEGFLASTFPVLRSLTDEARWIAMARDFYARHYCHSPLFLEIPREFLHYLEQEREAQPEDPPFLRELAHYEWVELALSVAEDPTEDAAISTDGDLLAEQPVLSPLAWAFCYRFPVHRIQAGFQPQEPAPQPVYLLIYRDGQDSVHFVELNAVSARLFDLLSGDQPYTGHTALQQITTELQHPNPDTVIAGGLQILQQWREMGVVSGTIIPQGPPRASAR